MRPWIAALLLSFLGAAPARADDAPAYRYYLGAGGGLPDAVPIELLVQPEQGGFGMRFFIVPPLTVKFTRTAPSENETFAGNVSVGTPATNVAVTAKFGPVVGTELLRFLSGGPFFLSAGLSAYQAQADASLSTPLLLCFSGGDCTNPDVADAKTNTSLHAHAHATVQGLRGRAALGWLERFGSSLYVSATGGLSGILAQRREIETDASMDDDPSLSDLANAEIQAGLPAKQSTIANHANDEIDLFDKRWLPILLLTAGVTF